MRHDKALEPGEETFRLIVETIPGLIAVMTPTGGSRVGEAFVNH